MQIFRIRAICVLLLTAVTVPAHAMVLAVDQSPGAVRQMATGDFFPAQLRQCSERAGPFATQSTAWQRLNQAERQGYAVSGVFPCYDSYGSRGYCFNVFYRC